MNDGTQTDFRYDQKLNQGEADAKLEQSVNKERTMTALEHFLDLGIIDQYWHVDPHDDHTVMELVDRGTRQVATIYGKDSAARRGRTLVVAAAPAAYKGMRQLRDLADRIRNGEIDAEDAVKVLVEIDQRAGLKF